METEQMDKQGSSGRDLVCSATAAGLYHVILPHAQSQRKPRSLCVCQTHCIAHFFACQGKQAKPLDGYKGKRKRNWKALLQMF